MEHKSEQMLSVISGGSDNIKSETVWKTVQETWNEYHEYRLQMGLLDADGFVKIPDYDGKKKFRGWFMTINNPRNSDWEALLKDNYQYICGQVEIGENGTPHIQAFIYYTNPRVKPVKKYPRAYLDKAESFDASKKYCSKTDTRVAGPFRMGEEPAQGKRTDLEELAKKVIGGTRIEEIAMEAPSDFIKYHKGLQALENLVQKNRITKPTNTWYWGLAGTGKTSRVIDKHGADNVYIKDGTMWWDGYRGQEAIVVDDFDGKWPYRDFLRFLDRYPYQGQVKGGYVKINSPFVYITCEFEPEKIYGDEMEDMMAYNVKPENNKSQNHLDQVLGRFDFIYEIKGCKYGKRKPPVRGVLIEEVESEIEEFVE